jgi:glutamate racemase
VRPRVGIFDSGVGGLSVWREIAGRHPGFDTLYVADQEHVPYGGRASGQVLDFARGITRFLAGRGCTTVVVACNTISAVALQTLRAEFADHRFIGMEPAIKPAAAFSQRKVIGVLGTPTTLDGELFHTSLGRFARDARVIRQACPGLVELIEAGEVEGERVESLVRGFLQAPLDAGADTLVLACTHYPFVRPTIERLAGPGVQVIDPAPAVARQAVRMAAAGAGAAEPGEHEFWTSGDVSGFVRVSTALLDRKVSARAVRWLEGNLVEADTPSR